MSSIHALSKARTVTAALVISALLTACQAGTTPGAAPGTTSSSAASTQTDTPPNRLPLKASLEIGKFGDETFNTKAVRGAHALNAVLTAGWVTAISSLLLAGPVYVVGKASDSDADCRRSAGNWRCSWDDVAITGDLRARAFGTKSPGGAPDFSFSFSGNFMGTRLSDYEGLVCQDCTWESGTWRAHDLKEKAEALTLSYRFTGDGDADFEPGRGESGELNLRLRRKIGELPADSGVVYKAQGDQRSLIVTNGATGGSRTISWDESTKAGRISVKASAMAQAKLGCWDSKGADTPCP